MEAQQQINDLGTESIGKLLTRFSIPAIIGMVVNMLYNVVDRIYIGNIQGIGGLVITGVGITMPITQIITGVGMYTMVIGAIINIILDPILIFVSRYNKAKELRCAYGREEKSYKGFKPY